MKKLFAMILAAALLCSCSASEEIPEENPIPEEPVFQEEEPENIPPEKVWFSAAAGYKEYGGGYVNGRKIWNEDNTLTFQHENTIITISAENEIIETVSLPKEHLPEGGYILSWNEKYIVAFEKQNELNWNKYGAVYFTDDGKAHLANGALFDRAGNFIKEYYQGDVTGYKEGGKIRIPIPAPEGTEIVGEKGIGYEENIFWISESKAVIDCHLRLVLYDFSADEGKVLEDTSEFFEKYGKYGGYYGIGNGGVIDGAFYYISHCIDGKYNTAGKIRCADENGMKELFGGKEFNGIFVGREVLLLSEEIDPEDFSAGSILYAADTENFELKEIWRGNIVAPIIDDGKIKFRNIPENGDESLFIYDYKTGEFFKDPDDRITNPDLNILKSPDGKYYVKYEDNPDNPKSKYIEPKIRIAKA